MRPFPARSGLTAVLALLGVAFSVDAQRPVRALYGTVRDEAGAPLVEALVTLNASRRDGRRVRTDSAGTFFFGDLRPGAYELGVLRLGFLPQDSTIDLSQSGQEVTITLQRSPATLDSVRILGRRSSVHGIVVSSRGFTPVPDADVRLMPTSTRTRTGPDGRFAIEDNVRPGAYVLFVKRTSFQTDLMAVRVPPDSGIEVLVTLDSTTAPGWKRRAMPLREFEDRSNWSTGASGAVVSAAEFTGHERQTLDLALRFAPSFNRKVLRVDPGSVCLFVDGVPRPFASIKDFSADQVAAVEVYRREATGTLAARWPRYFPCGDGSAPIRSPDTARYVNLWLKR
jgi:hypothetical protein